MTTKKAQTKQKELIAHASGKRKRAIARVTIRKGKSMIRINSKLIDVYTPQIARMRILEPILIAGELVKNLRITINVSGGGWSSQAEAARLAVAKALVDFTKSEELRKKYLAYDRHLLVADTRYKETCKPLTHSKARRKRQKSKR